MGDLKRTELRHRMLRAASIGKVLRATDGGWNIKTFHSTHSQMVRALNSLEAADLLQDASGEIIPSRAGDAQLSRWNTKYGLMG